MLDKRTHKIVLQLNKLCSNKKTYEIVELAEILKGLPKKYSIDIDGLKQDLQYLQDKKYIDIRHLDDAECCLSLLANTRLYTENVEGERIRKTKSVGWVIFSSICSFACAFLGGFLACYLFLK